MKVIENFKYWGKHWFAFNNTAIRLHCWKLRFIFHDWEKPWLQIILNHKRVSRLHRKWSRHHAEYMFPSHLDFLAMVIDWECSAVTKPTKPLNARETCDKYYPYLRDKVYPILEKLKIM